MTRKDYILIAEALLASKPNPSLGYEVHEQYRRTCERMAEALADDNPRFEKSRFYSACGLIPF